MTQPKGMRAAIAGALLLGAAGAGAAEPDLPPGWHVSAASPHSAPSGHRSGGDWRVADGVIVGRQAPEGNGGLLVTDAAYRDVEVTLETAIDWGMDSGLFFRTTPEGAAYQVMIDVLPGGTVGGIWGEQLSPTLDVRPFVFGETPAGSPWREGWNELKARIAGDPPRITTWLNGKQLVDWQDDRQRLPPSGPIALQIHGGERGRGVARFRDIRIVPLD